MEHTSPDKFADAENMFNNKYPIAKAPTESIAMAASPCILAFLPRLINIIAHITVMGNTSNVSLASLSTPAIAIAPNATCDKPSPINENLFKTSVTPKSEEHKEINTPTIIAYLTKGY